MLDPKEHRHDEGEDTAACANCRMEQMERRMGGWEVAAWNWYMENITQLTMESGAAGLMLHSAANRLDGAARRLFLKATTAIYQTFERVGMERAKAQTKGRE